MKVVFLEEVEGTARTGDVKNVAAGFARNYLLPRKLAAPATAHYITIAEAKATKDARAQSKLDEGAQKLLPKIEGKEITVEVRVGEQEKLFGSVTAREIAEQLQALTKIELEHRQIALPQPLRELGDHEVTVKLTRNVLATVTVHVVPLGGPAETEADVGAAEVDAEAPAGEAEAEAAPLAETEEAAEPEQEEATPEVPADEDSAPGRRPPVWADAPPEDEANPAEGKEEQEGVDGQEEGIERTSEES